MCAGGTVAGQRSGVGGCAGVDTRHCADVGAWPRGVLDLVRPSDGSMAQGGDAVAEPERECQREGQRELIERCNCCLEAVGLHSGQVLHQPKCLLSPYWSRNDLPREVIFSTI